MSFLLGLHQVLTGNPRSWQGRGKGRTSTCAGGLFPARPATAGAVLPRPTAGVCQSPPGLREGSRRLQPSGHALPPTREAHPRNTWEAPSPEAQPPRKAAAFSWDGRSPPHPYYPRGYSSSTQYAMPGCQKKLQGAQTRQKVHFKETKQASEPGSDMAGMLGFPDHES